MSKRLTTTSCGCRQDKMPVSLGEGGIMAKRLAYCDCDRYNQQIKLNDKKDVCDLKLLCTACIHSSNFKVNK
jgi:hypothetical protein